MKYVKYSDWKKDSPILKGREKLGASRFKFAAIAGVSLSGLQAWERGTTIPRDLNMEKLAKAMNVQTDELKAQVEKWAAELESVVNCEYAE